MLDLLDLTQLDSTQKSSVQTMHDLPPACRANSATSMANPRCSRIGALPRCRACRVQMHLLGSGQMLWRQPLLLGSTQSRPELLQSLQSATLLPGVSRWAVGMVLTAWI